jgi:enoyl-CoA hydratase/carnithine racemase
MLKMQAIPQPVIAEVQGVATAAGCQLVAACDLAIAAEEVWFATPGVKIGLFCTTPMVALTRAHRPEKGVADAAFRRTGGCPDGGGMGTDQRCGARR